MKLFFENIIYQPWNVNFKVFLLSLVIGVQLLSAQNQGLKMIDLTDIDRIIVEGDQIFEIEVYAENRKNIEISSLLDGEYQTDFLITAIKNNQSLEIKLIPSDFSSIPDDKRNAHKVVAATLKLSVPNDCNLEVESDVGYVIAKGRFKTFLVNLQSGYFNFNGMAQYLRAETVEGNVYFKSKNTVIEAYSAQGKVLGELSKIGDNKAVLKSIRGDISINKTEQK